MTLSDISMPAKAAAILGAAGFFVSMTAYQSTSRDGVVTSCQFVDYGALVLGGAALIVGLVALVPALGRRDTASAGTAALGLALGAYHVAAGLGQIGSPCG